MTGSAVYSNEASKARKREDMLASSESQIASLKIIHENENFLQQVKKIIQRNKEIERPVQITKMMDERSKRLKFKLPQLKDGQQFRSVPTSPSNAK